MFRIGVCDDEAFYREDLYKRINHYFKDKDLEIEVRVYESGAELLKDNERRAFDLVFLDIEMSGMDGMETGVEIRMLNAETLLFFVTSHPSYVRQAFQLNAFQYLRKPVEDRVFDEEMGRVMETYRRTQANFRVKWNGQEYLIKVSDITYVETDKQHCVFIHTTTENHKMAAKLNTLEEELAPYGFLRIHRGYLINMAYVCGKKKQEIKIQKKPELWLPISRDKAKTVDTALARFRKQVIIK